MYQRYGIALLRLNYGGLALRSFNEGADAGYWMLAARSEQLPSVRGKQLPFDNEYLKEEIIKVD